MKIEEINEVTDKAERLRLFKEYLQEELSSQKAFDKFDTANDDNVHDPAEGSLTDDAGGMMPPS